MKITKKHLVEVNMRRYHLAESVEEKQRIDEFIGKLIKGGKWIISKIKKNPIGAGLTGFYGHQLATDDQIGIGGRVYSADERKKLSDKTLSDAEKWEAFKKYGAAGLGATGVAILAKSIYDKQKEKKRQKQDEVNEGLFGALAGGWLGGGKDLAGMAYGAGKVKKALSSIPAKDRAAMQAAIAGDPKLAGMVGGVKDLVRHKMRKKALGTAAGAYLGHKIEKAVKDDDDE
jgi:hypothetical protein